MPAGFLAGILVMLECFIVLLSAPPVYTVHVLKGTVARVFDTDFLIPINRPDLDDGPQTGINFGRCACAEKRAFYALSCMLKRGTNGQFRYKLLSPWV